jgi:hypothetical protein
MKGGFGWAQTDKSCFFRKSYDKQSYRANSAHLGKAFKHPMFKRARLQQISSQHLIQLFRDAVVLHASRASVHDFGLTDVKSRTLFFPLPWCHTMGVMSIAKSLVRVISGGYQFFQHQIPLRCNEKMLHLTKAGSLKRDVIASSLCQGYQTRFCFLPPRCRSTDLACFS